MRVQMGSNASTDCLELVILMIVWRTCSLQSLGTDILLSSGSI